MPKLTRKYRERFKEAAADFLRGYHYAQNSPLLRSLTPEEFKYMACFFRALHMPCFYGIAKACEDAARQGGGSRMILHLVPQAKSYDEGRSENVL